MSNYRAILILAVLFFALVGLANGQEIRSNKVTCQTHSGELICEVLQTQSYEAGEALRLANLTKSKTDTEFVIQSDTIQVRYGLDKVYRVFGYGSASGTTQELDSSTSVKDIRNKLVVILSGVISEAEAEPKPEN